MSTPTRSTPAPPMALWVGTSLGVHAIVAIVLMLGGGAWRARLGEHGTEGAGSPVDLVEVTIAREEDDADPEPGLEPQPEPGPEPEPGPGPEPEPDPEPGSDAEPDPGSGSDPEPDPGSGSDPDPGSAPDPGSGSGSDPDPGSGSDPTPSQGSAQSTTEQGRAPSGAAAIILGSAGRLSGDTVRASALLGESLSCDDPIAGTWVAYRYSPEFRDWARFTLRIEHDAGDLRGTIVARMWRGLPSERRPPACTTDGWDYTVTMRATGNLIGDRMAFGSSTHEITRVDCASSFFSYNPDHFSGSVDSLADRMHTVNNDGGRDVNAPYEFRRTSCTP